MLEVIFSCEINGRTYKKVINYADRIPHDIMLRNLETYLMAWEESRRKIEANVPNVPQIWEAVNHHTNH